jgi:hypothetical protein
MFSFGGAFLLPAFTCHLSRIRRLFVAHMIGLLCPCIILARKRDIRKTSKLSSRDRANAVRRKLCTLFTLPLRYDLASPIFYLLDSPLRRALQFTFDYSDEAAGKEEEEAMVAGESAITL